jgi:hypothetical protein
MRIDVKKFSIILVLTIFIILMITTAFADTKITSVNVTYEAWGNVLRNGNSYYSINEKMSANFSPDPYGKRDLDIPYYVAVSNTKLYVYNEEYGKYFSTESNKSGIITPEDKYAIGVRVNAREGYYFDENDLPEIKLNGKTLTSFEEKPHADSSKPRESIMFSFKLTIPSEKNVATVVFQYRLEAPRRGATYKAKGFQPYFKAFPGSVTDEQWIWNKRIITGETASLGEQSSYEITVKLTDGYKFIDSPRAYVADRTQDYVVKLSDTEYKFGWNFEIEATDKITINDQSPSEVEYNYGETFSVFVNASGAIGHQWAMYEKITAGGPKQKYLPTNISGATSSSHRFFDPDETLDGRKIVCIISDDTDATFYSKDITLKMNQESYEKAMAKKAEEEAKLAARPKVSKIKIDYKLPQDGDLYAKDFTLPSDVPGGKLKEVTWRANGVESMGTRAKAGARAILYVSIEIDKDHVYTEDVKAYMGDVACTDVSGILDNSRTFIWDYKIEKLEETTKAPEITKTPDVTKTPEITKTPDVTKTPEVTTKPEVTKTSETSKKPESTKAQETSTKRINWSSASKWAVEELNKANELGVIPELFDKEDLTQNITRKEFAHVAVKLYEKISGKKAKAPSKNPFTDTKDEEVLKAYAVEITMGTSDTTFSPDTEITREQMATMMTRALAKCGIDTNVDLNKVDKFNDDAEMHSWGKESIYYMSNIEIIKGMGDNKFGVTGTATREQSLLISERSALKFAK